MSPKVLSVSWDESLQRSRVWVLESAGLEVRSASTWEDAIAALARRRFDLVVLGHSLTVEEKIGLLQLARTSAAVVLSLRRCDQPVELEFDASEDASAGPEHLLATVRMLLDRRPRRARNARA